MEKLTVKKLLQRIMRSLHIIMKTWMSSVIFLGNININMTRIDLRVEI